MKHFFHALLLIFLMGPGFCPAEPSNQEASITINKLRFGISNQELLLEQSSQEEQSLLAELNRLNGESAKHQQKISAIKNKIHEQERILTAKEQELITIMRQNETLHDHLIKRLKSAYIMGRNDLLTIAFSGKTLPELLLSQDAFRFLVTYDQNLFKEYQASILDSKRVTQAKQLEKLVLENFLADADTENEALQKNTQEKNDLLRKVQAQKGLYQLAVKEMRRAERELETAMQARAPSSPVQSTRDGFLQAKGQLPSPLWGEVVRRFQQAGKDDSTTFANGITITTPPHSEVHSIYSGTVLFAGPMRGYGNMVIIDHQHHYYSVSARLGEIRAHQGDSIGQGRVIGTTNARSNQPDNALYFEIRRDAVAEDPLSWLHPGSLALPGKRDFSGF